ncbi:hypothetical protein OsI_11573 [Oryza sativa Indica Group]|uniref:Uncharacterized protein n=1 Tax=Oryza sativa subsp. indica TaxID=39946 RepID=B8APG9_ORYSI|nr:hypothetical protein OsI_11573 [Oryza sativa Indica Group]
MVQVISDELRLSPLTGRALRQGARGDGKAAVRDLGRKVKEARAQGWTRRADNGSGDRRSRGHPDPVAPNHLETRSSAPELEAAADDLGRWVKEAVAGA